MKRATSKEVIPTVAGTPFAGGFYVARYYLGAAPFVLVVAPKASGERAPIAWNEATTLVKGALSYADGLANTAAMAKAGSKLARWARGLQIGGHKDWYLPSRLESLLLFGELRQLKPFADKGAEAFERHWYWTSTQYAGHADYAWIQGFGTGGQYGTHKSLNYRARAVRRIAL